MEAPQNKQQPIDVGRLTSALLQRRTIIPRFRLPYSKETARDMLLAAIMAEVQFRHCTFKDSVEFRHQLDIMAEWLTDGSGKFGILLCGQCGNGKSTWMKALQQLINYLQIPDTYMGGVYGMPIVKTNDITEQTQEEMFKDIRRLSSYQLLAIDDLGTEPKEVMHYGNISSPMIRLIDKRYDEQLFTIITTNLAPCDIKKVYGERTSDRLAEMMQILPFDNPSYRSNKTVQVSG